jgi:hypothetical protein
MTPLYDQGGHIRAWLTINGSWLVNCTGRRLAYVDKDSIYDRAGRHVAWWASQKVLDHGGLLVLVGPDVPSYKIELSAAALQRQKPKPHGVSSVPILGQKPPKAVEFPRWSNASAFLDALRTRTLR